MENDRSLRNDGSTARSYLKSDAHVSGDFGREGLEIFVSVVLLTHSLHFNHTSLRLFEFNILIMLIYLLTARHENRSVPYPKLSCLRKWFWTAVKCFGICPFHLHPKVMYNNRNDSEWCVDNTSFNRSSNSIVRRPVLRSTCRP